jgi:HAD superfamily hydrolase (TIGR01484 family)
MNLLQKIAKQIPIATITTKDTKFVTKRTPFACAWATIGGLEITANGVTTKAPCLHNNLPRVNEALKKAREYAGKEILLEEKTDSDGTSVAFSIDWRGINEERVLSKVSKIAEYCQDLSLEVIKYDGQPFFDVFPCQIDKGKALTSLKKTINVENGVLYLGDSATDNPAFKKADIAIGVIHSETPNNLTCNHFINSEKLDSLLEYLIKNALYFNSAWPMIIEKKEAAKIARKAKTQYNDEQ